MSSFLTPKKALEIGRTFFLLENALLQLFVWLSPMTVVGDNFAQKSFTCDLIFAKAPLVLYLSLLWKMFLKYVNAPMKCDAASFRRRYSGCKLISLELPLSWGSIQLDIENSVQYFY